MKYRSEAACHLASRIRPAVRKRVPTLYPRQCRDCSIRDRKPATLSLSRTSSGARVRNSGEPPWSMVTETLAPLQRLIPQLKQRLETSTYLQLLMDGGGGGSRSATIVEFSNDFGNSMGSISEKRQKATVQVQNRYRTSAGVNSESQRHPLERTLPPSSAISARSSWLPASYPAKEPRLCGPPVPHHRLG